MATARWRIRDATAAGCLSPAAVLTPVIAPSYAILAEVGLSFLSLGVQAWTLSWSLILCGCLQLHSPRLAARRGSGLIIIGRHALLRDRPVDLLIGEIAEGTLAVVARVPLNFEHVGREATETGSGRLYVG
jgi:hypothetical protein